MTPFDDEATQPIRTVPKIVAVRMLPAIPFTQSPHCQRISRPATQFIVLHATCGSEQVTAAEAMARMMADPALQPKRSAHYGVDADSIVQCVRDPHVAWHAGHTGNQRGIGVELCGLATQTREQWYDALSLPMLNLAARLVASLCGRYSLPRQFVPAADLLRGVKGITTHNEVRLAWKETTHTDPGNAFPLLDFIRAVQLAGP